MAQKETDANLRDDDNDDLTDEQLVLVVQEGNHEAYRLLVERHKNYVYTLILRMIGQRETAEDLAQDVFLRMYRSISAFRGESKFTTWLYRLTVNRVTDYRRSQSRRPVFALMDKLKNWLSDRTEEPEYLAVKHEEQQLMQKLLSELPDKYRIILYLFHYKQLTYQEIAQVVELPIKTVETRLYRGKALLREKWLEVNGNAQIEETDANTSRKSAQQRT